MLEETGLPYHVHWVDIDRGDQFEPEFLKISPNNKIPAIVDSKGPEARPLSMFESGSILIYLAEKSGRFLPDAAEKRWDVLQWLFWQVGGFGPMLGQAHHFNAYAPRPDGAVVLPYAQERYTSEASRLYRVLDTQLAAHEYVAADCYSIADIAIFPWCRLFASGKTSLDSPLLQTAAHRGRLMEILSSQIHDGEPLQSERAFLVGMLSLLDVLFHRPLEEVLRELHLDDVVQAAILKRDGPLGALLTLVLHLEATDFGRVDDLLSALGIAYPELQRADNQAYSWIHKVMATPA